MKPIVSIKDVIGEMDLLVDGAKAFINKETGELITLLEEEISVVESGEEVNEIFECSDEAIIKAKTVLESDEYLPLPDKFEIHEYQIMKKFCYTIQNDDVQDELLYQIHGSGAFGRFKNTIHKYNIADKWYKYRQETLESIAEEWLKDKKIEYTR
jgi:hypothetical protein